MLNADHHSDGEEGSESSGGMDVGLCFAIQYIISCDNKSIVVMRSDTWYF